MKWLLAIPRYIVLFFLWIAFVVASVVAFFAILFTGRYPRGLFEFDVGVLRWSWRQSYYGTAHWAPIGTRRSHRPTCRTLRRISRWSAQIHCPRLALVKWWLLAIPLYLVVGVFVGGGTWVAWQSTTTTSASRQVV